jgi:hypothetical protein
MSVHRILFLVMLFANNLIHIHHLSISVLLFQTVLYEPLLQQHHSNTQHNLETQVTSVRNKKDIRNETQFTGAAHKKGTRVKTIWNNNTGIDKWCSAYKAISK